MDYQSELKNLNESGNYWKPKAGQFKIKALSELEPAEDFVKKSKDEDGNDIEERSEQTKLKIWIDEDVKLWTFGKGKTPASTYGQLVEFATKNGNSLMNKEFTVVVKSDGKKNDYTIVS